MFIGRVYTISFSAVAVTAAQDLFEILAAAEQPFALLRLQVGQHTDAGDAEAEMLHVSVRRVTGAPTSGSGGSTPTAHPIDEGDTAFGGTVEANNTTQLTGGTNVVLNEIPFHVAQGLDHVYTPETAPRFRGSTRLLVELEAAPADSLTMDGTITIAELN